MCHKYRGGAGKAETKSIIASTEDAGISRWSALRECPPTSQAPPPQSRRYAMHRDQHIDLSPCTKCGIGRDDGGGRLENGATIIITFHAALYGPDTWSSIFCSTVTFLWPIYKRYLYILIFEHPRSQRKEIETKRKRKS